MFGRQHLVFLRPCLGDFVIGSLSLWLIAMTLASADGGLLLDAATGCHIRTGEGILATGSVPRTDPFSFTRYGQPWFAWEWLSDVLFAVIFLSSGMQTLVVLCAAVIAVTGYLVVRRCLWAGADALSALIVFQLWVGASSLHFLARPHIFTLLFMAIAVWLIKADRRSATRWLWALVPLTILWVNLHGGFVAVIVSLVIVAAGSWLEALMLPGQVNKIERAKRYLLVAGACLLASVVNPYGLEEHRHLAAYLSAGWIRQMVEEFQSPRFHDGSMIYFELLLVAGILTVMRLLSRREIAPALLVLAWAHASLMSVRHIPIYAIVCAPLVSRELTLLRDQWITSRRWSKLPKLLSSIGRDYTIPLSRVSCCAFVPAFILIMIPLGAEKFTFSPAKFPTLMVDRWRPLISSSRIFTLDSWADYLTFRLYPNQRIFVDGRSNFFGEDFSLDYLRVLNGQEGWDGVLTQNKVDVVMVPKQSAIASLLRAQSSWKLIDEADGVALFRAAPLNPSQSAPAAD